MQTLVRALNPFRVVPLHPKATPIDSLTHPAIKLASEQICEAESLELFAIDIMISTSPDLRALVGSPGKLEA